VKSDLQAKSINVYALKAMWFNDRKGLETCEWHLVFCVTGGEIGFATLGVAVVSIMDSRSFKRDRRAGEAGLCFFSSVFARKHSSGLFEISSDVSGMVDVQRAGGKDLEWSVDRGFAELDGQCLCCSWEIPEV